LACDRGHEFESWFPGSAEYEAQLARCLVTCPFCDSANVEKQIMAPSVARKDRAPARPALWRLPRPRPIRDPGPVSDGPSGANRRGFLRKGAGVPAMLKAFREHVTKNAENVGQGFADLARKMHYGETEHRSIYGEANLAEAKELLEEGIEVHPLPNAPDERN
jgi:hypothetical protein